jgi:hypothetical protein
VSAGAAAVEQPCAASASTEQATSINGARFMVEQ